MNYFLTTTLSVLAFAVLLLGGPVLLSRIYQSFAADDNVPADFHPQHLVVLSHGFLGTKITLRYLEQRLNELFEEDGFSGSVLVLNANANSGNIFLTTDGILTGNHTLDYNRMRLAAHA